MSTPAELDRRLRTAAGPAPDAERALDDVMRRIDRRKRRRNGMVVVTAALFVVGLSTWLAARGASDESSVFVGDPSTTAVPSSDNAGHLRELWRVPGVGPGSFVSSGGDLILLSGDRVLVAEGFGSGSTEPTGRITALAQDTGDEAWSVELGGPAFLQGTTSGIVVANTQHERIVGLDAADGEIRWDISLTDVGLEGYGAVTSAITESVSAIGVSANSEGDTRAPVVLGIDTTTGELLWTTPLVDGTDLMWGTPPVRDHHAVFSSTLSHPGSAEENVAQLLDLADGSIVWTVGMGGSQGFSDHPAIIADPHVHLPAHPDVLTVDLGDGERRWTRHGYGATLSNDGLWLLTSERTLELVDPATGDVLRRTETPIPDATKLMSFGDGTLAVVSAAELVILDRAANVEVRHRWSNGLSAVVRSEQGEVFVAGADATVTAYAVESTSASPAATHACEPLSGDEPSVDHYAVTAVPDGFTTDGQVQHSDRGPVDAGGQSESVLRLEDPAGRWIEVISFGSYDPAAFLSEAHAGASTEVIVFERCLATSAGTEVVEQQANVSVADQGAVLGAQEWEYGGFLVVGGSGVTVEELIAVASGLRLL